MYIVNICDFETQKVGNDTQSYTNINGDTIFLPIDVDIKLFGFKELYVDGDEVFDDEVNVYVLKKGENFINVLKKCFDTEIECINELWFNNSGKFDSMFVIKHLLKKGYKFTHKNDVKENEYNFIGGDGIGYLNLTFKINEMTFIIKDFVKIGLASVKKMGKIIGKYKMTESGDKYYYREFDDFTKDELLEYIEYCKRDVEILADYMKEYNSKNEFFGTKLITAAGMAINYLVKEWENDVDLKIALGVDKVKDIKKFETFNNFEKWYKKMALSYYGGYTNFNKKYQGKVINKNILVYDINSAYPWAMSGDIPYKIVEKCQHKNKCNHIKMYNVVFKGGNLKKGYPSIQPLKNVKKDVDEEVYLSKLDKADVMIWDFKLDMLSNFYDDVEYTIKEVICFKSYPIFKKFIDKYYKIKEELSKELDELKKQELIDTIKKIEVEMKKELAKLCLNSTYGKFGENPVKNTYYHTTKQLQRGDVIKLDTIRYVDGKKCVVWDEYVVKSISASNWKDNNNQTVYQYVINKCKIESANNIIVASYITEKVRCKLFDLIKINPDEWLYSDTDSLIVTKEFNFPKNEVDKTKLGYWDIEGKYKYAFIFGTKKYVLTKKSYIEFYKNKDNETVTDDKIRICGGGDITKLDGVKLEDLVDGITLERINPYIISGAKFLIDSTVNHIIINKKERILK